MASFEYLNTEFPEGTVVKTSAFGITLVLPKQPPFEPQAAEPIEAFTALDHHPDFEAWTTELAPINVNIGEDK